MRACVVPLVRGYARDRGRTGHGLRPLGVAGATKLLAIFWMRQNFDADDAAKRQGQADENISHDSRISYLLNK